MAASNFENAFCTVFMYTAVNHIIVFKLPRLKKGAIQKKLRTKTFRAHFGSSITVLY